MGAMSRGVSIERGIKLCPWRDMLCRVPDPTRHGDTNPRWNKKLGVLQTRNVERELRTAFSTTNFTGTKGLFCQTNPFLLWKVGKTNPNEPKLFVKLYGQ